MHWISSLIILALFNQAHSSGVFELRLKSFSNKFGRDSVGQCCNGERTEPCTGPCRTRFRICLTNYQVKIDTTSSCTFGEVITPVLGDNSVQLSDSKMEELKNPIRFNFDFGWPGTFSLIVEAWHDNNSNTTGGSKTLITRVTTQEWLDVGLDWHEQEDRSSHTTLSYEYRVICDEHYYGSKCGNLCRPRNDQFGHYTCSPQGDRVCADGWTGDYCTTPRCLPGCDEQHGHCNKPNECLCHKGWKGAMCDQCERYPGCLHGTCQKPWDCLCDEGWGGLFCNQDLNYCTNHKPCHHDGTCFNTGQGSYTCNCPPGYTGTDCEKEIDDCAHQPCLNGGSCQDTGSGYICECSKNWRGTHCETSTQTCDDQPCENGGSCEDTPTGYRCHCVLGYTGIDCDHQIDDCASSPCRNGATCTDKVNGFECTCPSGFTGSNCETNIDDCNGNPCLNGGTCIDQVNNYRCQCVPGFLGTLCDERVDYCRAKPCANGGKCSNVVNDYRCSCRAGFSGKDCSIEIDECDSNPCQNGGTCHNKVNGFQCDCVDGWKGKVCQDKEAESIGNLSKRVSPEKMDSGLTTNHVVVIATFSTAVPVIVIVATVIVVCMKQRRKREQQRADDEARMQNEQNAVHSTVAKRGDTHMIKNTWGPCVKDGGGGPPVPSDNLCFAKPVAVDNTPVYTLHRSRSHKQLNTDASVHRQSNRASCKDLDNLTRSTPTDKRISVLSVDSSLCNASDSSLLKRPHEKDTSSGVLSPSSSVYVIDEHFPHHHDTLLATEV